LIIKFKCKGHCDAALETDIDRLIDIVNLYKWLNQHVYATYEVQKDTPMGDIAD
jgi:hypothetical protein